MAMTFSLHENLDLSDAEAPFEISPAAARQRGERGPHEIHLFTEKMAVPVFDDYLARPRLSELLEKTLAQSGAALVTGRAGTGKTALAADFSKRYRRVAWLSVEAAENDWEVFYRYFLESFGRLLVPKKRREILSGIGLTKPQTVAPYIENLLGAVKLPAEDKPFLIVIDGLHNVFDAGWFAEFFKTLLSALTPDAALVMLARSTPPLPLWRLRSKQLLGVIDEKLLIFTPEETAELFGKNGLPEEKALPALGKTFGRVSRLKEFIGKSKP